MKDEFAELIERLEAATDGSPALDIEIVRALGWTCLAENQDNDACRFAVLNATRTGDWSGINWDDGEGRPRGDCRAWPLTTSVDAALTLLPEWASFEFQQSAAGPPTFTRCRLHDWRRSPRAFDPGNEWKAEGNRSLPLNIAIVALKSRSAQP